MPNSSILAINSGIMESFALLIVHLVTIITSPAVNDLIKQYLAISKDFPPPLPLVSSLIIAFTLYKAW